MADFKTGFTPGRRSGSGSNSNAMEVFPVANSYATALFSGDPVKVSAGYITQADDTKKVIGVAMGFAYVDANGQTLETDYLPASTLSKGLYDGYSTPICKVAPADGATFLAKVNSSVSQGNIGDLYTVTIGTGSTINGRSSAVIDTSAGAVAAVSSADAMVRILGKYNIPNNEFLTTNTVVEVEFVNPGLE